MTSASAAAISTERQPRILQLDALRRAESWREPYPHLLTSGAVLPESEAALAESFPEITKNGYISANLLKCEGAFAELLKDLEGPEIAEILSEKLDLELRDKPRMITIRKWSAGNDGRIHNDGVAKIATSLLYLKQEDAGEAGRLRVLRSKKTFEDYAREVPPTYGSFFAFKRTENSWHGHKPYTGERRVIQITWLRSWEDVERKEKRGKFSLFLKKLLSSSY